MKKFTVSCAHMLFGIAGPTASGKTTVTNFLVEIYGAAQLRYSEILSEMAKERGLDPTDKATLQNLYITEREQHGEGWLAKEIAARTKQLPEAHLVIEGNRRKVDIETLKAVAMARQENWLFIFVDASPDTRFLRYNERLIRQGKPTIDRAAFDVLEQNPAEDEVNDLRTFAKSHGLYIDTDALNIEETLELVRSTLHHKKPTAHN